MDAQSNLWTAIRRLTLQLISAVALQLLFALIFDNAAAQPRYLPQQEN